MIAGTLSVQMEADLTQLAQDMKEAERTTASSMERIAATIGAGMAAGWEKAKTAWDAFKDWTERQIVVWGVALAIGVSAAVLGAVYVAFKGISFAVGLLTGESYKSANIDALVAMNKEVKTLQQNLPLTAVGASALNEALKAQGTTADAYATTINSVSSAVRTNQSELDRLGVTYKDQNGNFLSTTETLTSAAEVLKTYTEGWDRNQAALAIGMGTEKQIQDALAVTAEKLQVAKDRLIAYGLVIGTDTQDAVKRYEDSMRAFNRELDLTSQGFSRAVADNIMPVLTDLADFFRDGFPMAVMAFRYSLATVTSLFYGLKTAAFIVAEAVLGAIEAIGQGLGGLAVASARALQGDFGGAKNALVQGWQDAQKRLGEIGDNIVKQAEHNSAAMRQAWGFDSIGANGSANGVAKTGQSFIPKGTDGMDEGAIAQIIAENYASRVAAIKGGAAAYIAEINTQEKLAQLAFREGGINNLRTQEELILQQSALNEKKLQKQLESYTALKAIADTQQGPHAARDSAANAELIAQTNAAIVANETITQAQIRAQRTITAQQQAAEYNAWQASMEQKGAALVASFGSEAEITNKAYADKLAALEVYIAANREWITNDQALRVRLETEHQAALGSASAQGALQRAALEKMTLTQQAEFYFGTLEKVTAQAAQHNRAMFEINKMAAIANAVMSTATGMTKALEWGFPMGPIFAAVIGAAGAINIATILGTSFGGGGVAPSVSSAAGGATPTFQTNAQQAPAAATQKPTQTTIIDLGGMRDDDIFSGRMMRKFVEKIEEGHLNGDRLVVAQ